ncbi:MAG: methyltransferase domain-containing protein [Pegethrix bostrychoides GSE-TBD4-15B]|jgi:SAM-dependent methyltransferase|uniref:Methyltransferase domain-containing protein n=1 Tax=Pegethrix bostrychoides GSE-TBD4-15B TaxID=2839662 RepID=A0A951U2U8_9CYAN|nr:methyltransferase domain-containing protein [Pegethrix bostrychoides GSE-TBD4-15B]
METRQEKILACLDPATQTGLEIGALSKPIVTSKMGDIRYVDYATTAELQAKYAADPNVETEDIVEVNYIWGEKRLVDLVGDTRFDYVIASHVIEHVPDLIGWLKEIHAVLKPGGILSLAIPDKRYCFDYFRQLTQPADVVDAYLRHQRKPGPRQVFEFFSQMGFWQGHYAWGQDPSFRSEDVLRVRSDLEAWQATSRVVASESYHDVHCWVFTPDSLTELLKTLIQINLFDFKVIKFYPPEGCEFHLALEALDLSKDENVRQQMQLESLLGISLEPKAPSLQQDPQGTTAQLITAVQISTAELARDQERLKQSRTNLKRLKADKQRLRQKVQNLQAELANREQEIAAMQSSKFWRLRTGWIRLKQLS